MVRKTKVAGTRESTFFAVDVGQRIVFIDKKRRSTDSGRQVHWADLSDDA